MKKQYSCELMLGETQSSPLPNVQDIAEICREWLLSKPRAGVTSIGNLPAKIDLGKDRQEYSLGEKANVKIISHLEDAYQGFAIKFMHPDNGDPSILWIVDICFSQYPNKNQAKVSVITYVAHTSGAIRPIDVTPSQPKIVKQIIKKWGAREILPIRLDPITLCSEEVGVFLELLGSSKRNLPILLISSANVNDRPIVNVSDISSQVAGICHVFVTQDRWVSFRLKDKLGESFTCWNGAIRIYWPGFSKSDSPFHHRLWTPSQILNLQEEGSSISSYFLGFLLEIASAKQTQSDVTWSFVESKIIEKEIKQFKDAGDLDKLFDAFSEQNEKLCQDKKQLEDELIKSMEEQQRLRYLEEVWRKSYLSLKKEGFVSEETIEVLPPTSVAEVVDRVKKEFGEKFIFALNSQSSVDDNFFQDCLGLYEAFRFLATTYYESKTGELPCDDLDLECRGKSGFFYSANQSRITIGRSPEDYYTSWDGNKVLLKCHIGKGNSKDPRYCIRIAFDFLEDQEKILIGYIGQHQTTSSS